MNRVIVAKTASRLLANPALAPQSDEGITEVIDCLMRHCRSEEHAAEVVTEFLDTATDPRNITAELAGIAKRTRVDMNAPMGFPGCELCDYSGWLHIERNGYDFSEACSCRPHAVQPNPPTPKRTGNLAPATDWASRMERDL